MTAMTPTTTMDQAWQAAVAQAETLSLPDYIWERPQVQGFTIDAPTFEDSDADDGFRCVCKAIAWDKGFESEAIAPKKKRAKQLAARNMLEQLQKVTKE